LRYYRAICSKCSNRIHPEFRDHVEYKDIIECKRCGKKMKRKDCVITEGKLKLPFFNLSLPESMFPENNYYLEDYYGKSE